METRNIQQEHEYILTLEQGAERCELDGVSSYEYKRRIDRVIKGQMLWECGERVRNCLYRSGIRTDFELLQKTPQQLLAITMFGKDSLASVQRQLGYFGYRLPREDNNGN